MPQLVDPQQRYQPSFLTAWREFEDAGEHGSDGGGAGSLMGAWRYSGKGFDYDEVRTAAGFEALVTELLAQRDPDHPRARWLVPATMLWWVEGSEWLGRVSIRHELNATLRDVGGHIGYSVRPGARRRGHATAILAASLPVARGLGIDPALVTCDPDNVASRRTIQACGGQFVEQKSGKLHFLVPTGDGHVAH